MNRSDGSARLKTALILSAGARQNGEEYGISVAILEGLEERVQRSFAAEKVASRLILVRQISAELTAGTHGSIFCDY